MPSASRAIERPRKIGARIQREANKVRSMNSSSLDATYRLRRIETARIVAAETRLVGCGTVPEGDPLDYASRFRRCPRGSGHHHCLHVCGAAILRAARLDRLAVVDPEAAQARGRRTPRGRATPDAHAR